MGVLLALTPVLTLSSPAHAQTRLQWPTAPVNLDQYLTVEECVAATMRVRDSVNYLMSAHTDTMAPSAAEVVSPLPEPAKIVAQRCAAKFAANTFPIQDSWNRLMQLYLQAGEPDHAWTILQRRLSPISADSAILRGIVIDSAVQSMLLAQPTPLRLADSLLEGIQRWPDDLEQFGNRFTLSIAIMRLARQAGDTSLARQAAKRLSAAWDLIPKALESNPKAMNYAALVVLEATTYLENGALMDSLRKSTAGYLAFRKQLTIRLSRGLTGKDPIGAKGTPLRSDFWFDAPSNESGAVAQGATSRSVTRDSASSNHVRPTPGRISLVVFLSHECDARWSAPVPPKRRRMDCSAAYSAIRRIARQYPELELTLVAQTYGFFSLMDPVAPQIEADSLRAWWLGFHKLPAALAVTNTAWFKLDAPDNRRVNEIDPNTEAYAFGAMEQGLPHIWPGTSFLLDEDGVIVHSGFIGSKSRNNRIAELGFTELINALVTRQRTRAKTTAAQ